MTDNQEHLKRVSSKINAAILAFCGSRTHFHMHELVESVQSELSRAFGGVHGAIAPDSASRILRDMKVKGLLNYEVLSRRNSHYKVLPKTQYRHAQHGAVASKDPKLLTKGEWAAVYDRLYQAYETALGENADDADVLHKLLAYAAHKGFSE